MGGGPAVLFFHFPPLDKMSCYLCPCRWKLMDFVPLTRAMSLSTVVPTRMSTPTMSCIWYIYIHGINVAPVSTPNWDRRRLGTIPMDGLTNSLPSPRPHLGLLVGKILCLSLRGVRLFSPGVVCILCGSNRGFPHSQCTVCALAAYCTT